MAYSKIILNGETLMDVTSDTVDAGNLLSGKTATKNSGAKITGEYPEVPIFTVTYYIEDVSATCNKSFSEVSNMYSTYYIETAIIKEIYSDEIEILSGSIKSTNNEIICTVALSGVPYYEIHYYTDDSIEIVKPASVIKTSADLTVSGSKVTVPVGYYSTTASKNVASTTHPNPSVTFASSTGRVTASHAQTAGYVAAGTTSVTYDLTTKAATTYYPSTADQTIGSYQWLTGAQTIKSITTSNLIAANIAEGVVVKVGDATNASRITQVTGTHSGGTQHTCTITGQGFTGCCIKYNGQNYTTAGTFTFKAGDKIHIYASGSQYGYTVYVRINGQGMSNTNYSYDEDYIMPDCDVNILLEYDSTNEWKHIYITTPQIDISANGVYDVVNYGMASVNVNVGGGGFTADEIAMRTISGDISGNATSISAYAFYSCSSLTTASFPNVGIIGSQAFYGCSKLTTVSFPSVVSIGGEAFYNCRSLTTVNFSNVTSIGEGAFRSCSTLTTVSFPSATSIGAYGFASCYALTTASFPNATSIDSYAFQYCYALTTVSFPSATSIGAYAFYACYSLTTASFPNATSIGSYAFRICSALTTASFPNAISIGNYAFRSCSALTTASFPNVGIIGSLAFYGCYSLTTISFPSVVSIFSSAFQYCYNLLSFYLLGSSVPTLGTSIFYSTPIDSNTTSTGGVYGSIFVPSSLYDQYIVATNWSLYSARIVSV